MIIVYMHAQESQTTTISAELQDIYIYGLGSLITKRSMMMTPHTIETQGYSRYRQSHSMVTWAGLHRMQLPINVTFIVYQTQSVPVCVHVYSLTTIELVDIPLQDGGTALTLASFRGYTNVVKTLLKYNADVNAQQVVSVSTYIYGTAVHADSVGSLGFTLEVPYTYNPRGV